MYRTGLPNPSVLFVLPLLAGGGAERVALLLEGGLKVRGWNTSLLLFANKGPLNPGDADIHSLDRPRLRQAMGGLLREIWRRRPNYIFSTLGYVNVALGLLRPLLPRQTRLVLREANMPSQSLPQGPFPLFTRMGYRLAMPKANCVISTSRRMAAEFRHDFHVAATHLAVLPNPIDEDGLRQKAMDEFPERRMGKHGPVRFVFAGRLETQKGLDQLLPLLARLTSDWRLTIFGDGSCRVALQEQAVRLGLGPKIDFAGYVEQPCGAMAAADALLLPSRWEGMPNVALESLALGTSVIATPRAGGIEELAASAPAGAVSIAEIGADDGPSPFLEIMQGVESFGKLAPAPSLLPAEHRIDAVITRLEDILRSCR